MTAVPPEPVNAWDWVWQGVVFLVCGIGLFFLLRPARGINAEQLPIHTLPAPLTPWTVAGLLRQIDADDRVFLSPEQRVEIAQLIQDLEHREDGPYADGPLQADLERLAREWIDRAAGGPTIG